MTLLRLEKLQDFGHVGFNIADSRVNFLNVLLHVVDHLQVFVLVAWIFNWLHKVEDLASGQRRVQQCDVVAEDPCPLRHRKPVFVDPQISVGLANDSDKRVEEDDVGEHRREEKVYPNQVLTQDWVGFDALCF